MPMTGTMDLQPILDSRRNDDGGFAPVPGALSEPEPTALVAIATRDPDAAAWLEAAARPDGSVGIAAGPVFRDLTAVSSLAMRDPVAVVAAVDWVVRTQARAEPATEALPHDPDLRGWSWTLDTFGWVEPTAWAVLALRLHGSDGPELADGLAVLRDRECVGGGWNYGNRVVLDEALPPFVQPTGVVLLALHGLDEVVATRGLERLSALWRDEADGLLSVATAAAALRQHGHDDAPAARHALEGLLDGLDLARADTIALAWSAIALGDGLERLALM
jgi:hypothetical protein